MNHLYLTATPALSMEHFRDSQGGHDEVMRQATARRQNTHAERVTERGGDMSRDSDSHLLCAGLPWAVV